MSKTALLKVEDVHTYYDSSHVLQGVSVDFFEGVFVIVGRNGMGKSTLVKTIMGLVPAKKGKILLKGEDITNQKPYMIGAKNIGYVPQGRNLFPSLTVDEHFLLAARGGNGNNWDKKKIYDLFPRLHERAKQSAASLSGGEQQMLAIGRALITNPSLLIMDEPSEGLAPVILDQLIQTYHSLLETGLGILLIEQNLRTAVSMADHLHIMVGGRIVSKVKSEVFLKDKNEREKYLGVKV